MLCQVCAYPADWQPTCTTTAMAIVTLHARTRASLTQALHSLPGSCSPRSPVRCCAQVSHPSTARCSIQAADKRCGELNGLSHSNSANAQAPEAPQPRCCQALYMEECVLCFPWLTRCIAFIKYGAMIAAAVRCLLRYTISSWQRPSDMYMTSRSNYWGQLHVCSRCQGGQSEVQVAYQVGEEDRGSPIEDPIEAHGCKGGEVGGLRKHSTCHSSQPHTHARLHQHTHVSTHNCPALTACC